MQLFSFVRKEDILHMKKFKLKEIRNQPSEKTKENSFNLLQLLLEIIKLKLILKILEFLEK